MFKQSQKVSLSLVLFLFFIFSIAAEDPEKPFTFVVMGDMGCGCSGQEKVAQRLIQWHAEKPFSVVLMTGDIIYGEDSRTRGGNRQIFKEHFDEYYDPLRLKGVKFYASLGNHDMETRGGKDVIADRQRFNMTGAKGYYALTPDVKIGDRSLVTFLALNTVTLENDPDQVAWLSRTLAESDSIWEIPFFHHPIYTPPGKHEEEIEIRDNIENILVAAGVKVTFAGHNHFYARMKPQKDVVHFVSGGGGRDLKTPVKDEKTAEARKSYHFMYWEVYSDKLVFWAVPPEGPPFDTGAIVPTPPS